MIALKRGDHYEQGDTADHRTHSGRSDPASLVIRTFALAVALCGAHQPFLSLFAVLYVLHIISNRNESTYKTL